MQITKAEFKCSSERITQVPKDDLRDIAFIGRSNVGKSSLINMLTGRKGLAMTSSTPGKTLLINHFDIDGSWYIVDLPGYGYARRGKEGRENIRRIIERYVLGRESMTCLFVLIDSRHEPQKIDLEFMAWLGENGVPFAIVFTKADKLGTTVLRDKIEAYKTRLLEEWEELPPIFITSSETRKGRDELLDYIGSLNEMIKNAPSGADSPEGEET